MCVCVCASLPADFEMLAHVQAALGGGHPQDHLPGDPRVLRAACTESNLVTPPLPKNIIDI
eukprot:14284739-Alexandrium_andersonii.AAC.1